MSQSQRPTRAVVLANRNVRTISQVNGSADDENSNKERRIESDEEENGEDSDETQILDVIDQTKTKKKKKKQPSLRSYVHDYLTDHVREQDKLVNAKCSLCNVVLNLVDGPSTAKWHLKKVHDITGPVSNQPKQYTAEEKRLLQEAFNKKQALWVAETGSPFIAVEHPAFVEMMNAFQPWMGTNSAYLVKNHIKSEHETSREVIMQHMQEHCTAFSISLDLWDGDNKKSFMGIIGHFINNDWKYEEVLLDFVEVLGDHTGDNLATVVVDSLQSLDVLYKLLCLTGDNASNNGTLCTSLTSLMIEKVPSFDVNIRFTGKDSFVGCFAHVLNLVVSEFIDDGKFGFMKKVEQIAHAVSRNTQNRKEWKLQAQGLAADSEKFIPTPCKTRWNSYFRMLISAIDQRAVVNKVNRVLSIGSEISEDEWKLSAQLCQVLMVFDEATLIVSQKRPTITQSMGLYKMLKEFFDDVDAIKEKRIRHVRKYKAIIDFDATIINALYVARDKFDKYYKIASNTQAYHIGSILDPRIKDTWIKNLFPNEAADIIDGIIQFIKDNYKSVDDTPDSQETIVETNLLSIFKSGFNYSNNIESDVCDVNSYLSAPCLALQKDAPFDVLQWWKDHGLHYPILARVAKDFLSVPAASVSVERLFNMGKEQLGIRRHNLDGETMQQLMVVQHEQRASRKK